MVFRLNSIKLNIMLLFPFLFLFGRGSSWSICVSNYTIYAISVFVVSFLYYCYINRFKIKLTDIKKNCEPILLILFLLPSMLFVGFRQNLSSNMILILCILSVYFFTLSFTKIELARAFVDIICIIAGISLLFYTLFNVLGVSSSWMPLITKANGSLETFRTIFVYSIRMNDASRNCGPFWEPSIFAIYLCAALFFELFFLNRNKKVISILLITVFTTFSSGGVILLVIIFAMWMWRERKYSLFFTVASVLAVVLIILCMNYLETWLLSINYSLFNKIFNFSSDKSSMSRVYSVLTNVSIWRTSPLLGVGQVDVDLMYQSTAEGIVSVALQMVPSQSATPFIFLAAFGICGLYYSLIWIRGIANCNNLNKAQKILLFIFVSCILLEVPHTNFMFTYLFLFILLHKDRNIHLCDSDVSGL